MANFNKFKVTWEGSGGIFLGGANRVQGEIFTLPADQVDKLLKTSDFENGYLIPLDEDVSAFSSDILRQLDGKSRAFSKSNFVPPVVMNLVTTTTNGAGGAGAGYVGNELTGGVDVGRRGAVAKILSRTPTRSVVASTYEPRLLVSAGEPTIVAPTVVKKYVALTGVYSDLTNGSIAAANLAAADDMLVVGYTEKFASLNFHVGTAASNNKVFDAVYYWDGSAWNAFTTFSDMTKATYDDTNSLGKTDTIGRVVWWTKPTDWVAGGPAGAQLGGDNYCVALKVSGAMTGLVNCGVYPVMDTPIADIMLGSNMDTFDAVVTAIGNPATFVDVTTNAASASGTFGAQLYSSVIGANYGVMLVGYSDPFQAISVISPANQAASRTLVASYWNGASWSTATAAGWTGALSDTTVDTARTLFKSGIVSWNSVPSDWQPAPMTDLTGFTATGLTTVTTDALYWIQLSASNQLTGGTVITQLTVAAPSKAWVETTPVGSAFVEAGEALKVTVMDAETTATVEMKAVLMDV